MKKAMVTIGVVMLVVLMADIGRGGDDKGIIASELNRRQQIFRDDYVALSDKYHILLGREREMSELADRQPIAEHWRELRDIHVQMYETTLEAVRMYKEYIGGLENRLSELLDGEFIPSDVRFVR